MVIKNKLMVAIIALLSLAPAFGHEMHLQEKQSISIKLKDDLLRPRDVSGLEVEAFVDTSACTLEIVCYSDKGQVNIMVRNESTGTPYFYCADSALGGDTFALAETSGHFSLVIAFADGDIYEGTFSL